MFISCFVCFENFPFSYILFHISFWMYYVVLRLDKNQVTMPIIWIGFVQDGIFTV